METLFDQLKTETPANLKIAESANTCESIKSSKRSPSPESQKDSQIPNKIMKLSIENKPSDNLGTRRESMPPPATTFVRKNVNKSRSLSPPKGLLVKPFKVLIERKKMEDIDGKSQKLAKTSKSSTPIKKAADLIGSALKNGEKSPKKITPTKAQQKLFDPDVLVKAQQLTKFNVKRCKVRLLRQDLAKLKREFHAKRKNQKSHKKSSPKNRDKNDKEATTSKRAGFCEEKESKHSAGFFIKINELTRSPRSKTKVEKPLKERRTSQKPSAGTIAKKVNAAAAISSTKPTKFTRTQLIKMYGNRVFCSRVKIERCSHPMMLIFESNARARRLQAKRSKSKNLSVSFRDQVEIFGDSSDSEEADTNSMDETDVASTSEAALAALKSAKLIPISLTATPARLKKVENGKVVDDIELDPSLFVVPIVASTPFVSPGKKKRDKKSFSPLKGDGTPSPRKEQLKLANEKMPPSSLRRLTAVEVDEDDDEDDECEYIVPIEIPERRISRTSSVSVMDDVVSEKPKEATNSELEPIPLDNMCNKNTVQDSSGDSFASAVEQPQQPLSSNNEQNPSNTEVEAVKNIENEATTSKLTNEIEAVENNKDVVAETKAKTSDTDLLELPQLTPIDAVSPTQSLDDIVDTFVSNENAVDSKATTSETIMDNCELVSNINIASELTKTNDKQTTEELSIIDTDLRDTLDDDISLRLFVEDDTTANSNFLVDSAINDSEIVDGIVKERIDEISKDKHLGSASEAANLLSSKVSVE